MAEPAKLAAQFWKTLDLMTTEPGIVGVDKSWPDGRVLGNRQEDYKATRRRRRPRVGSSMTKSFKKGDKVAWDTSQGETQGKVVRKQTSETHIKSHKVAASKDNPQYIVRSRKSGKTAAHKPDELRKKS